MAARYQPCCEARSRLDGDEWREVVCRMPPGHGPTHVGWTDDGRMWAWTPELGFDAPVQVACYLEGTPTDEELRLLPTGRDAG